MYKNEKLKKIILLREHKLMEQLLRNDNEI